MKMERFENAFVQRRALFVQFKGNNDFHRDFEHDESKYMT